MRNWVTRLRIVGLFVSVLILTGSTGIHAFADTSNECPVDMSALDCQALYGNWTNWIPDNGTSACTTTGSATLSGSDVVQKIFNYLVGLGLTPIAAAGVMGNMQAESHFDPSIEQTPGKLVNGVWQGGAWEDLSTLNINQGGKGGVGLVQWDGGRRPAVIKYMMSKGLTDADFHQSTDKLLSTELDYVWQELNGPYKDSTLTPIQAATNPGDAAFTFHKYYEGSSDTAAKIQGRMNNATVIYAQYGSSAGGTAATSSSGCSSTSPDCVSASGVAKILCSAKVYDPVSYSESAAGGHLAGGAVAWHKTCPVVGPSCVLDCSGLVNIAVYDAFGVELNENTTSERSDIGRYWKTVTVPELQPGDIMQPNTGHVEIIDHVQGNTLYTFAAHTDSYPQPQQVGPASYTIEAGQLYLQYIGPGV